MKSGFAVILGRPNVGKSTLLNAAVGQKLAIVTHKAQTTRDMIHGVVTRPGGQMVLVDSPGIHEASLELGKRMMREVRNATSGAHVVALVVDASVPIQEGDRAAIDMVTQLPIPSVLVLNKMDQLKRRDELLPTIDEYQKIHGFAEYVPISALKQNNVETLLDVLFKFLPEGQPFYEEEQITDQPSRFLAAEIIREAIFVNTHEEIPYCSAVQVENWEEGEDGLLRLDATIYVERPSQKAIVIGKKGAMLKRIGTQARKQIEEQFQTRVFLKLFVKVQPNWRDRSSFLRELDYRTYAAQGGMGEDDGPDLLPTGTATAAGPSD